MLDLDQRYNMEISIEHLSLNFDKLEDMHYRLLKKVHAEQATKNNSKDIKSPTKGFLQEVLKSSNSNEDEFGCLQALKTAFHQEANALKKILSAPSRTKQMPATVENLALCQNQINSVIASLRDRVIAVPDFKEAADKALVARIKSYFDLASKDIHLTFSSISVPSSDLPTNSIDKMMDLCNKNSETFNNIESIASSLKRKLVSSFNEFRGYDVSYNKEVESLKNNLNQIVSQLGDVEKLSQDNSLLEITKKAVSLLNKSIAIDNEKNNLFTNAKQQTENTYKRVMNQLKDIISQVENSDKEVKAIVANEIADEHGLMKHQIVVTPSVEKRNMSMPNPLTIAPKIQSADFVEVLKSRNESPRTVLLSDLITAHSISPQKQNFFSPVQTSKKSFIDNRLLPKEPSHTSNYDESKLRGYVRALDKMRDDLKDSSRGLVKAIKRVLEPSIKSERANKFALQTLKESHLAFERLLKQLDGISYQDTSIYAYSALSTRRSSPDMSKQGFRSQSPSRMNLQNSKHTSSFHKSSSPSRDESVSKRLKLTVWSDADQRKSVEELYAILLNKTRGFSGNEQDYESKNSVVVAMNKVEKLVQLIQSQFERKYAGLHVKLSDKEQKLELLEQEITRVLNCKEQFRSNEDTQKNMQIQKQYDELLQDFEATQDEKERMKESYDCQIKALTEKISKMNESRMTAAQAAMIKIEDHSEKEEEEKVKRIRELEDRLKKQKEQYASQIQSYESQISGLSSERDLARRSFQEKESSLLNLANEIKQLRDSKDSEIQNMSTQNRLLQASLEKAQEEIRSSLKEIENIKRVNQLLEKELNQKKVYIDTLEEATANAEDQVNKIVVLTKENEEMKAHLNALEAEIINKQAKIVELADECEILSLKFQGEMKEKTQGIARENNEILVKLERQLKEKNQDNATLKEKYDTLSKKEMDTIEKQKELSLQIGELKAEIEISTKKISNGKILIDALTQEKDELQNEKELTKKLIGDLKEEIQQLKDKLRETEQRYEAIISGYEEDLRKINAQSKVYEEKQENVQTIEKNKLDQINQEKEQLYLSTIEKEKEIQKVKSQLLEQDETHKLIVKKFEGEITTLKIKLNKMLGNGQNNLEPLNEESASNMEALESEERDEVEESVRDNDEKTAFSLANSVVSFEYKTQKGESTLIDLKKTQLSTFADPPKIRIPRSFDRKEEQSPKVIGNSRNKSALNEANIKDSNYQVEDSEERDEVRFDKSDNQEKTAFSLANSVVSFEYQTQHAESAMLDVRKAQFSTIGDGFRIDYGASTVGQKLRDEIKGLQDQIDELKREKDLVQNEYEKYLRYKEENLSMEQLQQEIKELKAFLTQRDLEISNFKLASSQASIAIEKACAEYQKKIVELGDEIKELKKVQIEKSQEINENQGMGLKKMSTNDFKKEFESFEFSEVNPWKQSADFSQVSFAESQTNVDKFKKDNKRLREERRHLRDENEELRNSIRVFQDQIVSFSELQKSYTVANKDQSNEIIQVCKELLSEIFTMETLKDRAGVGVNLDTKEGARETLSALKGVMKENEEDMFELVKELEEYDKVHDEIEKTKERLQLKEEEMNQKITQANLIVKEGRSRIEEELEMLNHDMSEKLQQIYKELHAILKDYTIADINSENFRLQDFKGVEEVEKAIFSFLAVIREYIEVAIEMQDNYEKLLVEIQEREEKPSQSNQIKHSDSKKSNDTNEEKKEHSAGPSTPKKTKPLKRESTMDQLRRFLPRGSISESARPVTPDDETALPTFQDIVEQQAQIATVQDIGNQEHVKSLYEQIRVLQDENEKLQEDHKQMDHDFTMLKFVRDDLKSEILEKDELIKNLEAKLDKAVAELEKNDDKSKYTMEKEHIKSIFFKFMQSAITGQKDAAFELLKMLMSLLQLSEEDQKWITEMFKKKSKKGVFSKLFK